jgi:SOS-response transcriptional repressor LexA
VLYADLLKEYIKLSGKKLEEITRECETKGVSVHPTYISKLRLGQRPAPSEEISRVLAEVTGGDPEKLIMSGYIEKAPGKVKDLIAREQTSTYNLPKDAIPYIPENMIKTPLIGTIRAGQSIDRIENIEGYVLVESELLRGREGFALVVQGDSMNGDRIFEGDIVIVIAGEEVSPSDIAVVAVDAENATLKRVKCQEEICVLTASNPSYEAMIVPLKNVHILGKVVQVRRNV